MARERRAGPDRRQRFLLASQASGPTQVPPPPPLHDACARRASVLPEVAPIPPTPHAPRECLLGAATQSPGSAHLKVQLARSKRPSGVAIPPTGRQGRWGGGCQCVFKELSLIFVGIGKAYTLQ